MESGIIPHGSGQAKPGRAYLWEQLVSGCDDADDSSFCINSAVQISVEKAPAGRLSFGARSFYPDKRIIHACGNSNDLRSPPLRRIEQQVAG
jgi:hypothetical protein